MSNAERASGPVVWAAVIAATCLLLLVFRAALWLVVPFLLALVIHYGLRPLVNRLSVAGLSREAAAAIVVGAFLMASAAALALLFPWITAQAGSWQEGLVRYLEGGAAWLQKTLAALEARFPLLARGRLAEGVDGWMAELSGSFAQRHGATLVMALGTWIPALMLAPFLAFFFLRDGRRFHRLLSRRVPNAFFERSLYLLYEVDRTAYSYFQGLIRLTALDALTLAAGLWLLGISAPLALGLVTAVLAWVPFVGSIAGCVLVVLVAATDFPDAPAVAYGAIALFVLVRLLDDFVFLPLTIGRSLRIHPLVSVVMIFVGGAIAGVPGLMLVLPLLGVVMVVGETLGRVVTDPRLRARHRHARRLEARQAAADLLS